MKSNIIDVIYDSSIEVHHTCTVCGSLCGDTATDTRFRLDNGNLLKNLAEITKPKDSPRSCEKCTGESKVSEKTVIVSPPHIFTVKINSGNTEFPEKINIKPYLKLATRGAVMYELFAVVVYIKYPNPDVIPHYIAYC